MVRDQVGSPSPTLGRNSAADCQTRVAAPGSSLELLKIRPLCPVLVYPRKSHPISCKLQVVGLMRAFSDLDKEFIYTSTVGRIP